MKVNIIGAGITGLAAANFLTKKGHEVRVFDREPEIGGLAGFFPVEGTHLEKYYHHIFSGHDELIGLIKELNLEKELFFQRVKMGFYHEGHLYPFATAKDLLSFTPLKITDRIRLGLTSFIMMWIKDWHKLEKRSAINWLCNYSGDESCKIIWEPLLKMKFGDDYDRISAAWLWNRVVDRKKSKGKGGAKETLGYIKGGYKKLFDTLIVRIKSKGGEIYTNMPVSEIFLRKGKNPVIKTKDNIFEGDAALVTLPNPSFLKIAPFLPKEYKDELKSIKYQGSICVVLKLKKALSDYYWINISDPKTPFVGIIEHTNLLSPKHYGNYHLVYLTKYASSNDPIFSKPEEDICRDFIFHLERIFPEFKEEHLEEYWVFKDRFSQPVFVKNYSKMMPDISTPIKNLYLLNTSQIYPQSRCLNSSISLSDKLVMEMISKNGR